MQKGRSRLVVLRLCFLLEDNVRVIFVSLAAASAGAGADAGVLNYGLLLCFYI